VLLNEYLGRYPEDAFENSVEVALVAEAGAEGRAHNVAARLELLHGVFDA